MAQAKDAEADLAAANRLARAAEARIDAAPDGADTTADRGAHRRAVAAAEDANDALAAARRRLSRATDARDAAARRATGLADEGKDLIVSETLQESAGLLSEAVINHARVLAEDPDNPAVVIQAAEQLREAASQYVRVVLDLTGWGNPLHDLLGLEESPLNETQPPQPPEGENVEIVAKYKVRLNDRDRAMALARQRIGYGTTLANNDVLNPTIRSTS